MSSSDLQRALDKFKERYTKVETEEGREKGLSFQPSPSDVMVCTFAKCGTTWIQQVIMLSAQHIRVLQHSWEHVGCMFCSSVSRD